MLSTQTRSFPVKFLIRHLLVFLLFYIAWRYLSAWYVYRGKSDYILFVVSFIAAAVIASWPLFHLMKQIKASRILLFLFLLALILPWGEWVERNFPNAREDWSRQILKQAFLMYIVILILCFKPGILRVLADRIRNSIARAANRRFILWVPPFAFFIFSSVVAIVIFQKTPTVPDSASYLFQAKTFAGGEWVAEAPSPSDFFKHIASLIAMKDGRWFSIYSPGYPMMLAPAILLGIEWFVSPLLGAFACAIWIAYAKRWHSLSAAFLIGWLMLFSPFLLLISAMITAHAPELFLASAVIFLCRLESESPRMRNELLLFLLLALSVVTRSFSMLAFLAPILAYTVRLCLKRRSISLGVSVVGGIVLGVFLLSLYHWRTVGDPWTPPNAYAGARFGFGEAAVGQIHTPARAMENTSNHFLSLNSWLSGWSTGSLAFVLIFVLCAARIEVWDRVLLLACGTLAGLYFFYYYQDVVLGPRFFFVCAPILLLVIANLSFIEVKMGMERIKDLAIVLILALTIVAVPFTYPKLIRRLNPRYDQAGYLKKKINQRNDRKTLIFLDQTMRGEFVGWNDPFLRAPAILVLDLGARNTEVIRRYPDHDPLFFGLKIVMHGTQPKGEYVFYKDRTVENPGSISLFGLAMALQNAGGSSDADAFDVCYSSFLSLEPAKANLKYLDSKTVTDPGGGYRIQLEQGIVHAGKMILLPKHAWEESKRSWLSQLNAIEFSHEYHSALTRLRRAGESGKTLVAALEKIGMRIDQNRDGKFTNEELRKYLYPKIQLLEFRTYF